MPDPGNVQAYNRYLYALGNPIKYNDPSGHCVFGGIDTVICILAGAALILGGDSTNTTYVPTQADINSSKLGSALILAGGGGAVANLIGPTAKATVVGAAANATANATAQIRRDGTINPAEAGIAAGYGAVSGFAAPLPGWGYVISTVAGGAQQVTTDTLINGQPLSEAVNINTGIAAGLSFAGAIAQGSMPSTLEYPTSDGGKFNVETLPVDYAPVYTRETTRQLSVEQAAYAGSIKYISGYFISSLPVSVGQDAQYSEPIRGPR